jgi:hypothetical protein
VPSETIVGHAPPHQEVEVAFAAAPTSTTGVCIGHGNRTGIGSSPGQVWADASDLGALFRDRRLYAFACNTAGGLESLGAHAVEAGIRVFVGHDATLEAPFPPQEQRMVEAVAGAAIIMFIDGQDDELALINAIDDAALEIIPESVPLEFNADRGKPNNWTQRQIFDVLASSLHVHRRARREQEEA